MKLPHDKRWRWGLGSVATTLAVAMTVGANQQNDKAASDIAQPAPHKPRTEPAPAGDSLALERLKRSRMAVKEVAIFNAKSWYVPPPPPKPAPPPPPSAPPLPFTFLGKKMEPGGKPTIFLAGSNRVYLVKDGETIDNIYRVEGVEDGKLVLTYLPLQIKQYIHIGEAP